MKSLGNNSILGFESIQDFVTSCINFKNKFVGYSAIIGSISAFITHYIWDDPLAVYTLLALIIFDAILAIITALKNNQFTSKRFPRFLLIMVVYSILLALGWNLSKASALFIWLPSLLYFSLCSTQLISIFENLVLLKLIPQSILNDLLDKIKRKEEDI